MKLASLLVLFSVSATAATQYELRGAYPHPSLKKDAQFTLRWVEDKGKIQGKYDDSISRRSVELIGARGDQSRIFRVDLGDNTQGVGSVTFITSEAEANAVGSKVPVSVVTQDRRGYPLASDIVTANLVALGTVQRQEENCEEGFGSLRGYCGVYEGMVSENSDASKTCNLTDGITPSLQLDPQGNVLLHIGAVSELAPAPVHRIGRVSTNPRGPRVDVMSRECRPLAGTTFPGDNCKRVNLVGSFGERGGSRRFTGTYNIVDEKTGANCSYQLSLNLRSE